MSFMMIKTLTLVLKLIFSSKRYKAENRLDSILILSNIGDQNLIDVKLCYGKL